VVWSTVFGSNQNIRSTKATAMADRVTRLKLSTLTADRALGDVAKYSDAQADRITDYYARLEKMIANEDLTGALIRGHLCAESEMAMTLKNVVPFYDKIPARQLMFEAKVAWLRGLALISSEERLALEKLNELRNAVAHISKPGVVPELKVDKVACLWKSLAPGMLEISEEVEPKGDDPGSRLRRALIGIVVTLYIRSDITQNEFCVEDLIHYHLTGETVGQRIEAARQSSPSDSAELKSVREAIRRLQDDDRDAIRAWIREMYHY